MLAIKKRVDLPPHHGQGRSQPGTVRKVDRLLI